LIQDDLFDHLTLEHMIDRRQSQGGTASHNVAAAIADARAALAAETAS
jgi:argininosuccinate lyase